MDGGALLMYKIGPFWGTICQWLLWCVDDQIIA